MKVAAGTLAAALVVAYNAIAITPAVQERRAPVGRVTIAVCGEHIVGGWRDGELPMLMLPLATPEMGWGDVIDLATLRALGFRERTIAAMQDTTLAQGVWPAPRQAWLTLRQEADSGRRYAVVGASAERPAPAEGELVVRGLVNLERIWKRVDPAVQPMGQPWELGVGVTRLLPPTLGLDVAQAEALKPLRQDGRGVPCAQTVPMTLAFGARGRVWVESVNPTP